jgi:RNA binding exosome subunit
VFQEEDELTSKQKRIYGFCLPSPGFDVIHFRTRLKTTKKKRKKERKKERKVTKK